MINDVISRDDEWNEFDIHWVLLACSLVPDQPKIIAWFSVVYFSLVLAVGILSQSKAGTYLKRWFQVEYDLTERCILFYINIEVK